MADNELLTPSEVAVMFKVNPKTVTRWARAATAASGRRKSAASSRRSKSSARSCFRGNHPPGDSSFFSC